MRKHKNKIIAGVIIAIVLAFVFWYGGDAPGLRGWSPEPQEDVTVVQNDEPTKEKIAESTQPSVGEVMPSVETKQSNEKYSEEQGMVINEVTGKDQYRTDPVPEGKPVPIEPENAVITDKELSCTLSVRCDTILQNIGWLDSEKIDIVRYNEDPAQYISASLAPADVISVTVISEEEKSCRVVVPNSQLSLAIGNKGQNARLAAKLTGWKIDINPETQTDEVIDYGI